jgi:peptidyl-prolyl cis-trans isomerase B (cyclophilin B)
MVRFVLSCFLCALLVSLNGMLTLSRNLHSFGYVVEGSDFLSAIKEGDIITSAKVTEGLENFKKANED